MELTSYSIESKQYEKSLDSAYKKDNGIFYTDIELAQKIIKFLNIPQNATIMDPCCGTGSFLVAAKYLGYLFVYGADIDKKAVSITKDKHGVENAKTINTLANTGEQTLKKFGLKAPVDFLIGNPPYAPIAKDIIIDTNDYLFLRNVKDSGSNLYIAALYRAFELVKPQGTISYIIPKNFLHVAAYGVLRRMILKEKRIVSIVDIGKYFKSVRGEQIILTLENSPADKANISIYKYEKTEFVKKLEVPQEFYTDEILLFNSKEDFTI